jgi:hypothetical protein
LKQIEWKEDASDLMDEAESFSLNLREGRSWKKPHARTTEITRVPYGHYRWKRAMRARERLLGQRSITWDQHLAYKAKSKRRRDPRDDLTFDSDSYQIVVDNGASYL